jgi:hypothetical protein
MQHVLEIPNDGTGTVHRPAPSWPVISQPIESRREHPGPKVPAHEPFGLGKTLNDGLQRANHQAARRIEELIGWGIATSPRPRLRGLSTDGTGTRSTIAGLES